MVDFELLISIEDANLTDLERYYTQNINPASGSKYRIWRYFDHKSNPASRSKYQIWRYFDQKSNPASGSK